MNKNLGIILFTLFTLFSFIGFSQKTETVKEFLIETAYFKVLKSNTAPEIFNNWKVFEHDFSCAKKSYYQINTGDLFLFPLEEEIRKVEEIEDFIKKSDISSNYFLANANVLDFLLENPEEIPNNWENIKIYFRGTLFQDKDGYLIIRYMYFDKDRKWKWNWDYYEKDEYFSGKILLIKK